MPRRQERVIDKRTLDALAVEGTPRERTEIGVVACLDAGRAGAGALPDTVRKIILVQDGGSAGDAAWTALQDRYANGDVVLSDANDDLNALGAAAFRNSGAAHRKAEVAGDGRIG